jgi:hypothetical protein
VPIRSEGKDEDYIPDMPNRKSPKGLALAVVTAAVGYSLVSCAMFNSVHYVLPNGYIGLFKIVLDETNGLDVRRKFGRATYEIPPDGVLRVKSFEPFRGWHQVTASYRDGTEISTSITPGDDEIAYRNLGSSSRGHGPITIAIVVGTKEQTNRIVEHLDEPEFDTTPP